MVIYWGSRVKRAVRFHAILWCDSNNMGPLCLTVLLVVYPEDLQLTCLWAAAQARGVRPVLSTAFTSVPTMIKFKNILNTPVTKKQRIASLCRHCFHCMFSIKELSRLVTLLASYSNHSDTHRNGKIRKGTGLKSKAKTLNVLTHIPFSCCPLRANLHCNQNCEWGSLSRH